MWRTSGLVDAAHAVDGNFFNEYFGHFWCVGHISNVILESVDGAGFHAHTVAPRFPLVCSGLHAGWRNWW